MLTVLMVGSWSLALASSAKLDEKAVHLIDRENQKMYRLYEVKSVHFSVPTGKTQQQTYEVIKKQVDALAKEKSQPPIKGNPASFFCAERLKGKNLTFVDLTQNEFAICQLPDGILVDAWDAFRLLKK